MLSEQDKQNLAAGGFDEKAARSPSPRMRSVSPGHTAVGTTEPPRSTTPFSLSGRTPTLFKRASRAPTVIPRSQAISRKDLIESAERIFYRYLSPAGAAPGSSENHEIYLPPALRIHTFPLSSTHEPKTQTEISLMAQIPDMFHAQKEYCYRAMEQDAFPRFLRAKAFGNLTPVSALVRLIAGLVVLWIGLAAGFSLIFLDVQPKSKRFFVSVPPIFSIMRAPAFSSSLPRSPFPIPHQMLMFTFTQLFIPYTLAILFLISHQYELDPVLVFLGQSESTPFRTLSIREPYVKKLLLGRAIWVSVLVAACWVYRGAGEVRACCAGVEAYVHTYDANIFCLPRTKLCWTGSLVRGQWAGRAGWDRVRFVRR